MPLSERGSVIATFAGGLASAKPKHIDEVSIFDACRDAPGYQVGREKRVRALIGTQYAASDLDSTTGVVLSASDQ
jgi:hypothetical protein